MASSMRKIGRWDRVAMALSGFCVLHCAATAIFVALAASIGGVLAAGWIHEAGLAIAIVLGVVALGRGLTRHGLVLPLAIGMVGLAFMAYALSLPHGGGELMFTVIGVSILALGHFLNLRASREV